MDKTPDATVVAAREVVRVEKREVVTGTVTVDIKVDAVEETVTTTLAGDVVTVERIPVGREVSEAPRIRTEGDVTIIPIVEEVLVVEKRLVLKEEIRVRTTQGTRDETIPVVLRRQRAVVGRKDPARE